jgi:threonine/homoserine/homoserine lactone efflux protein
MITPILKGLLLGVLLSISIGPVIFAILKQSITQGKKAGYAFVVGVSTSDMTLLFVCNVFTSFFELVLKHRVIIALLGAGFLLLMGLYTLLFKKIKLETEDVQTAVVMRKRDYVKSYAAGFFMNTLNPSVFLFWFAWTAAIGADAADVGSPTTYKLLVFGTCLLFVLVSDLAKVILAGALRPRLNEKNLLWINRIAAIIILIFSAVLFYNAIRLL